VGKGKDVASAGSHYRVDVLLDQLCFVEVFLVCLMREASAGCDCDESTLCPESWRSFM
jgi:hypothetical protein